MRECWLLVPLGMLAEGKLSLPKKKEASATIRSVHRYVDTVERKGPTVSMHGCVRRDVVDGEMQSGPSAREILAYKRAK